MLRILTIRQRLADLLSHERLSCQDLASRLGLPIKEIIAHLEHVRRSTRPPRRFRVEPAACQECGFVFADRRKIAPPGRCPKCKSELVNEPRYGIE